MERKSWFSALIRSISNEYERRIRAASEVVEYGQSHDHDSHPLAPVAAPVLADADDDNGVEAEILNVPRGTRLRSRRPTHSADSEDDRPAV